jgi:hypothetical protein
VSLSVRIYGRGASLRPALAVAVMAVHGKRFAFSPAEVSRSNFNVPSFLSILSFHRYSFTLSEGLVSESDQEYNKSLVKAWDAYS